MYGIRWWLVRPRQAVREKRLLQDLCPRCGSPRHVPVLYGPVHPDALAALLAEHPDAFVLGGCLDNGDPQPDRSCQRCRYRFCSRQGAERATKGRAPEQAWRRNWWEIGQDS